MDTTISITNIFSQMSLRIIKEQEMVIGPLALDEAKKVAGFHVVDYKKGEVSFDGEPKDVLDHLVTQYERLFGKISHEICRESVQDLIAELPADQVPASLK